MAASSEGISTAVLGAVLGSILGFLLLLVILLTLCLLRRSRRRRSTGDVEEPTTSSFWNRSTFLTLPWSRPESVRHTPIWTGWQLVDPEDASDPGHRRSRNGSGGNGNRGSGNGSGNGTRAVGGEGTRSPGEGSPRGSGDEIDPFLVRHSVHSATFANEPSQAKTETDTLVSVPPPTLASSGPRNSPRGGHIIPRDILAQRMREEEASSPPYSDIRLVQPSSPQEYSPLMPPPPLDPDSMKRFGVRGVRPTSEKSVSSQKPGPSVHSEKSLGSLDEQEQAELLVAKRVRVGDVERTRMPTIESDSESSASPRTGSSLGLSNLGSRLGRFSWFKRLSGNGGGPSGSGAAADQPSDSYTHSPTRSRAHSRSGSQSRLLNEPDVEAATPQTSTPQSAQRRSSSGLDMSLLSAFPTIRPLSVARSNASRPLSSLSARTTASGQSVYHDAASRPPSSLVTFPVPAVSDTEQTHLARQPPDERMTLSGADIGIPLNPPPAYDDTLPQIETEEVADVDILDVPAPASLTARQVQPPYPPGLPTLPTPQAWRESYASSPGRSDTSSAGIDINIEDDPPEAQEGWRDLTSEREGRRRTFGTVSEDPYVARSGLVRLKSLRFQPNVVHQPSGGLASQRPSVHESGPRLRPRGSRSPPLRSNPPSSYSGHTGSGSASSRPSTHSPLRSMSSAQSIVYSEERQPSEDLYPISPPLSAVMGSMGGPSGTTPSSSHSTAIPPVPSIPVLSPVPEAVTPPMPQAPPPAATVPGTVSGTVTSNTSSGTGTTGGTNTSVTTAGTDPITGAAMHFPPVPTRRNQQRPEKHDSWGVRRRDDWP